MKTLFLLMLEILLGITLVPTYLPISNRKKYILTWITFTYL